MSKFSEYTRLRDIVVKRLKRRGSDVHVPTVKEIKQVGKDFVINIVLAYQTGRLQEYIYRTDMIREAQKVKKQPKYTEEEKRARKREADRQYRRRKVAKEHERIGYPNKYQSYVKGLRTMGVDIPPSKLPAFFAYMDYRLAQGNTASKYVFDIFVDDYQRMLQKGYKPDQILSDFQKFESDQAGLNDRFGKMEGVTVEKAIELWDKFIK